jgi:hypothetical protein
MIWSLIKDYGAVYLIEDLSIRQRLRDENLDFVRDSIMSDIPGQIFASTWNLVKLLLVFRVDFWGSELNHTAETYRSYIGGLGGTELTQLLPNIDKCNQRPNERCGALNLSSLRISHYASAFLAFAFSCVAFRRNIEKRVRTASPRACRLARPLGPQ